jgi:NTP pyrophosphatase (non-canonical NTP hydrolase)
VVVVMVCVLASSPQMVGETGELAELFQWRGDGDCAVGLPSWTQPERQALRDELADVLLYLVQLSTACGVDLVSAAQRKMALNALKYPVDGSGKTTASKEDHRRAVEQLDLQTQPKQEL